MLFNYLWLPIIFMIHDFEEIIFVPLWLKQNRLIVEKTKRQLFGGIDDSSILSIGVFEEFVILILLSVYCKFTSNITLYTAIFISYFVHLFFHVFVTLFFKKYTPGVLTAIIQIPLCFFMIKKIISNNAVNINLIIIESIIVFILLFINVLLIHKAMRYIKVSKWLE